MVNNHSSSSISDVASDSDASFEISENDRRTEMLDGEEDYESCNQKTKKVS